MAEFSAVPSSFTFFRPPTLDDLEAIHAIEAASYPADEAANLEKLKFRIEEAPGLFLVAVQAGDAAADADTIIGFACGTASSADQLTHESMSRHEPDGQLCCIHSVAVEASRRRNGIASRLLRAYLAYVAGTSPGLREVRLICKDNLIPLYEKAGFRLIGPSDVEHGLHQWHEMACSLADGGDDGQQQQTAGTGGADLA